MITPGFVANRILMPMINEAIYALHENVSSVEGIDTVMMLRNVTSYGTFTFS